MQLVRVAHRISGIRNGQIGEPQQLGGLGHAVGDQEILGRLSHIFMEDLTEIASVQAAGEHDLCILRQNWGIFSAMSDKSRLPHQDP